jgi:H+/Cl- antiporter ClcA
LSNDKDRVYNLLKKSHSQKYTLIKDSLLVGLTVGIVMVVYRFLASELFHIFEKIYIKARENIILIPLIFLILIILGYIVAKQVKKEPMISGSGIPQVEGILTRRLKMNWFRILYNKFIGGLICLGVGLSVGREGPSVQMGACIGEGVSKNLKKLLNV